MPRSSMCPPAPCAQTKSARLAPSAGSKTAVVSPPSTATRQAAAVIPAPGGDPRASPPELDDAQLAAGQIRNDDRHAGILAGGDDREVGGTLEALHELLHSAFLAPPEKRARVPVGRKERPVFHLVEAVQAADGFGKLLQ